MSRNESKAVPESNGPAPHDDYGYGEPTMAELYRMLKERSDRMDKNFDRMTSHFGRQEKKLDELIGKMRATNQRLAGLQRQA